MIILATWLSVIVVALALYLRQAYSKLSKAGVNNVPVVPIFGNVFSAFVQLENFTDSIMRAATTFPKDNIVGFYQILKPMYIINDLETLKKIAIKDFEYFVDRSVFVPKHDALFGKGLLNLAGEDWKEMRSTLSPAFTSSKIRLMVPFMVEVGEEMVKVLEKRIKESGNNYIDVELKDMTTRCANDVIATCAFGLKVDSQSVDNEFYIKSKDIANFNFIRLLKIFFFVTFPSLVEFFKVGSISERETTNFFQEVVLTTMKNREKGNIIRHDMINILNEVKKGKLTHEKEADTDAGFATVEESTVGKKTYNREWTDEELVAQAVLFLVAGFETISTALTFLIFELANQPEIQQRLVDEFKDHDAKNGGKFDFNSVQSMKYLDMVVSEGLRMYPPAAFFNRECIKDYNAGRVNSTSNKDLIIRKGDVIGLPFWNFLRNPELFPEPLKFDPERFSDENKHNIKPHSYLPFGLGPRNCIGSRFALCEMKVILYHLLRKVEVVPCEKTVYPPQLKPGFLMLMKTGAWVRLRPRL